MSSFILNQSYPAHLPCPPWSQALVRVGQAQVQDCGPGLEARAGGVLLGSASSSWPTTDFATSFLFPFPLPFPFFFLSLCYLGSLVSRTPLWWLGGSWIAIVTLFSERPTPAPGYSRTMALSPLVDSIGQDTTLNGFTKAQAQHQLGKGRYNFGKGVLHPVHQGSLRNLNTHEQERESIVRDHMSL